MRSRVAVHEASSRSMHACSALAWDMSLHTRKKEGREAVGQRMGCLAARS